jgi:hypothetical protein
MSERTLRTNGNNGKRLMQQIPLEWLQELDELLALTDEHPDEEHEARLISRLVAADPDLLTFLVGQFAEQGTPQAAALLEMLAVHPDTTEPIRAQARAAAEALGQRGITAAPPGKERFYAGWVQSGRERGEQILILGSRLSDGDIDALVFLLDWRGDGLKDYYRTRRMRDAEWRQLLVHNGAKGAPLVEVTLGEARTLLDAAIAESKRFSRPMPREYKVDSRLIERRILSVVFPPAGTRSYVSPSLGPEQVVGAYIAALHYRDYRLAADLLSPVHTLRADRSLEESAEALRTQLKHAPRHDEEAHCTIVESTPEAVIIQASGTQTTVQRTGRRLCQEVTERYTLSRHDDEWRIGGQT